MSPPVASQRPSGLQARPTTASSCSAREGAGRRSRIPDPGRGVEAAAGEPLAVGAEADLPDVALMPAQPGEQPPVGGAPDPDDAVLAGRGEAASVGREIEGPDGAPGALELARTGGRWRCPRGVSLRHSPTSEQQPVRGEVEGGGAARMMEPADDLQVRHPAKHDQPGGAAVASIRPSRLNAASRPGDCDVAEAGGLLRVEARPGRDRLRERFRRRRG